MIDTLWRAYHGKGAWRNNTALTNQATSNLQRAVIASIQGYLAPADIKSCELLVF